MKKQFILITLIFLISQAFSQSFNFGFGASLNYTNLVFSGIAKQSSKYKIGFQFNAKLGYSFNDKVGISLEPGYANRGFIRNYYGGTNPNNQYSLEDARINLNYLIFPILIKYSPIEKLSITIGPEYSYLLSEKLKADNLRENNGIEFADNMSDIGIIAGLSYQIIDNLEIGFYFNRGFLPVEEDISITDKYGKIIGTTNTYNHGFAFSVAYLFN